jgi:hypothetical protein
MPVSVGIGRYLSGQPDTEVTSTADQDVCARDWRSSSRGGDGSFEQERLGFRFGTATGNQNQEGGELYPGCHNDIMSSGPQLVKKAVPACLQPRGPIHLRNTVSRRVFCNHANVGELDLGSNRHLPDEAPMRYKVALLICVLALPSCIAIFGYGDAEKRFAGLYILESVDGVALPAPLAPQQGCNRTVRKVGTFSLSPAGPDVVPMYDWEIKVDADCQPVPTGVFQGESDVGNWRLHSTHASLNSLTGKGAYGADFEESSGPTPSVTLSYLGNSYRFRRFDEPFGVVYVTVVDQFGQPVEPVILHFTFQHGLEGGGTIGPAYEFGTSGPVGECSIRMTPPPGYEVPASQPNPFTVTLVESPAIHVQAKLTKL